jgi:drug/metabolite transporter (DMT)-like permease
VSDRPTIIAFIAIILIGGSNAVAIRLGNAELTPFVGATLRFGLAALLLLAWAVARRTPLPTGRARLGVVLYGLTSFTGSNAALYWGLVAASAATAMVAIATVPQMTLLIAVGIGQERLTARGLAGALIALAGVALIVGDQVGAAIPPERLAALFVGAAFIASSGVIVKQVPPGNPIAANGIGMAIGAVVLGTLAVLVGDPLALPTEAQTWGSILYLAIVGSVGLFMAVLYVLARWSASATSYATLVMPLVTVALAAVFLGETVTPTFLVGAAIALVGVYVGVALKPIGPIGPIRRPAAAPALALETPAGAALAAGEIDCRPPGC